MPSSFIDLLDYARKNIWDNGSLYKQPIGPQPETPEELAARTQPELFSGKRVTQPPQLPELAPIRPTGPTPYDSPYIDDKVFNEIYGLQRAAEKAGALGLDPMSGEFGAVAGALNLTRGGVEGLRRTPHAEKALQVAERIKPILDRRHAEFDKIEDAFWSDDVLALLKGNDPEGVQKYNELGNALTFTRSRYISALRRYEDVKDISTIHEPFATEGSSTFHSNILSALNSPNFPKRVNREALSNQLQKNAREGGITADELKFSGFKEYVDSFPKGHQFDRDELRKFMDANQVEVVEKVGENPKPDPTKFIQPDFTSDFAPKFSQYQLGDPSASKNYRELVLTWNNPEAMNFEASRNPYTFDAHWKGINNPLAHMRVAEHELKNGGTALHAEEFQSDAANDIRKYLQRRLEPEKTWDYEARKILEDKGINPLEHGLELSPMPATGHKPPDMPLIEEYPKLAARRLVKLAADEGHDALTWTTGQQQADRWSQLLRQNVKEVSYDLHNKELTWTTGEGQKGSQEVGLTALPEYIGRDNARKMLSKIEKREAVDLLPEQQQAAIIAWEKMQTTNDPNMRRYWRNKYEDFARNSQGMSEPVTLQGDSLSVGARGYEDVYDKKFLSEVQRLAKQFGGKVEKEDILTGKATPTTYRVTNEEGWHITDRKFESKDKAENFIASQFGHSNNSTYKVASVPGTEAKYHTVWSLRIPKTMRSHLKDRSLPLFQTGAGLGLGAAASQQMQQISQQPQENQ